MRSALLGAYFCEDQDMIERFVTASTKLTHTDPRALTGAMAVARLAAWAVQHGPRNRRAPSSWGTCWRSWPRQIGSGANWWAKCWRLGHAGRGYRVRVFPWPGRRRDRLHVPHRPVAVYAWLRHFGDFRAAVEAALDCGGDTDTVGAIVGALAGGTVGAGGIPADWIAGIIDWPRSVGLLRKVASRLGQQKRDGHPLA